MPRLTELFGLNRAGRTAVREGPEFFGSVRDIHVNQPSAQKA